MWLTEQNDNIKLEFLRFFILGFLTVLIFILLFIMGSLFQTLGCVFIVLVLIAFICVIGLIVHILFI
jgi:hypothetical protein